MDFSVYHHLAKEQRERYLEYRQAHPTLSEAEARRIFFSQIHEMNLTKIINQGLFAKRIWFSLDLSRRKQ